MGLLGRVTVATTPSAAAAHSAALEHEERRLAGRTSGLLYVLGSLTLALLTVLPGVTHAHRGTLYVLAAASCLWGGCQVRLIDWNRTPRWLIHVSNVASLALIALVVADTGAGRSPAWVYLFLVIVPAAYFYRPSVAVVYFAGCVVTHALVLIYDPSALHQYFLPQFVIAVPSYLALGAATLAGKRLMLSFRLRAEELAAEQGALRRVATAIARDGSPERIYELVAREAGWLLGAGAAGIMRVEDSHHSTVMGSWADRAGGRYAAGTVVPIRPGGDVAAAIETRKPVRISAHQPNSPVDRLGYSCSVVAPIVVADRVWGVLAATAPDPDGLDADDERRLTEFGDLLQVAITSIEDRAKLVAQASSDPLTGLSNHRTLRERLAAEAARATRHGSPLSVAVLDVDYFKQINDAGGHEAGDEMLVWVAGCLSRVARSEDTLARVGGDEFAWVLPETTREQALVAVQRAREVIGAGAAPMPRITVSAGICDVSSTDDPTELIRRADQALYWSKQRGRDQAWVYDPIVADEFASR
jgi:diguanylate cyclase (GGDEF)-like protein